MSYLIYEPVEGRREKLIGILLLFSFKEPERRIQEAKCDCSV